MRGGTLVFRDLFFVLLRRFFGPLDVLFVSLFLPRLKAAATLTDPGGGGGGTVWGIFAATQTTRKTRICQKNKKSFARHRT